MLPPSESCWCAKHLSTAQPLGVSILSKSWLTGEIHTRVSGCLDSKQIVFRKPPRPPNGHRYTKLKEEIEKRIISSDDKREIIKSLKFEDHDYTSFFVCRNPVDKLLSIFDMKAEHHATLKTRKKRVRKEFFSWPQLLSKWSRSWR